MAVGSVHAWVCCPCAATAREEGRGSRRADRTREPRLESIRRLSSRSPRIKVQAEEQRPSATTVCTESRNSFMSPPVTTALRALGTQ